MSRLSINSAWRGPNFRSLINKPLCQRLYHVLAIESSCDDATVALIERKTEPGTPPLLIEHVKKSLDNTSAGGIIPLDARNHHQKHLAPMVRDLMKKHGITKPDIICATRGPGMIGSLSAGYNLSKGLAVAWDVPLVGVHHMLGHLLTPRFFQEPGQGVPQYPFISLLVSGGHTMLVLSRSTLDHEVLANTVDIAIGDMLDKCARELGVTGSMLGKEMEQFINEPPATNDLEANVPDSLVFPNPLQNKGGRVNLAAYSFAAFITALRIAQESYFPNVTSLKELPTPTRREIARRIQYAIFNHLSTKTALAINQAIFSGKLQQPTPDHPLDFVCAGGVASNLTLRQMLQTSLKSHTLNHYYPAPKWCTDNALMIGWAGIELWEQGLSTDISALPTAKWPITELMDMPGWLRK